MRVTLDNIEESLLPLVSKPNRYLGNYEGAVRKDHGRVSARVALAFPDCFDLGMSHLGLKILYRLINRREDALAELTFAPWPDMEEQMREHGLPLFTLESRTPVSRFDLVGFSLQYELHYTTVLNMLDLSGIPLLSKERSERDPLVIAGGPCAFSPEPMADFMDAFLIGDGEEAVGRMIDLISRVKESGGSRGDLLEALSKIDGTYVPSLYRTRPNSLGHLVPEPDGDAPAQVAPARIKNIGSESTEPAHLAPLIDVTHSRLSVEVMRGCPRNCRFCMPGSIYRPVRRKSERDVVLEIERGMADGGWDEVALLSLSTSDYKGITKLVSDVSKLVLGRGVNVSLPSIRPGTLPPQLARTLTYVRKSGLTFAPEAGTERLRKVIGKDIDEREMIESVKVAAGAGWNAVKLYFMIGLPTETEQDVVAIAELASKLKRAARSAGRKIGLKISVAGFVPKAHTPFQWEAQIGPEELEERISTLNRAMKSKGLRARWRDAETTFLEGLLSRGDRTLAALIHAAWKKGCRFDGWSDQLDFESWRDAIKETGIDPRSYLGPRKEGESQPWSHIGSGRPLKTLEKERDRMRSAVGGEASRRSGELRHSERPAAAPHEETPFAAPGDYGATPTEPGAPANESGSLRLFGRGRRRTREPGKQAGTSFRLQYAKGDRVRFISHLDVVRAFDRALRRARLPVAFSEGFSKHPKLAFGPPLAVGMTSTAEYLDLEFATPQSPVFAQALSECLPEGLKVLRAEPHGGVKPVSLMSAISRADYRLWLPDCLESGGKGAPAYDSATDPFLSAAESLRGHEGATPSTSNPEDWRRVVEEGSVLRGEGGRELHLKVRLNVSKGAKISEIGKTLLAPLAFDPRLLRVERTAVWVARGTSLVNPFEALSEIPWDYSARLEGKQG